MATTTSQAALDAPASDTQQAAVRLAKARKTIAWAHTIAALVWIWYEALVPLALVAWIVAGNGLPPAWVLFATLALVKVHTWRAEIVQNVTDTYRRLIILQCRLEELSGRPAPRIETLTLGQHLTWRDTLHQFRTVRHRAIPYTEATITVRPKAWQGADRWADTWTDFMRRRHGFNDAELTTGTDPNTYTLHLRRTDAPTYVGVA